MVKIMSITTHLKGQELIFMFTCRHKRGVTVGAASMAVDMSSLYVVQTVHDVYPRTKLLRSL